MINMLKEQVLNTIKKYNLINENDKIICGVSGGPDSICMLDILKDIKEELKFELIVCHVNHLIREEAISDEEYVANYCKVNNIKCYVKRIDVKKYADNNKQGTEEAGRNVRYEFFEEILQKEGANKIAIAHNKNDKIESFQWICKQNQNCTRNCSDIRSKEWNYICHSYNHTYQHCIWHIQNCQANKAQQTDNC